MTRRRVDDDRVYPMNSLQEFFVTSTVTRGVADAIFRTTPPGLLGNINFKNIEPAMALLAVVFEDLKMEVSASDLEDIVSRMCEALNEPRSENLYGFYSASLKASNLDYMIIDAMVEAHDFEGTRSYNPLITVFSVVYEMLRSHQDFCSWHAEEQNGEDVVTMEGARLVQNAIKEVVVYSRLPYHNTNIDLDAILIGLGVMAPRMVDEHSHQDPVSGDQEQGVVGGDTAGDQPVLRPQETFLSGTNGGTDAGTAEEPDNTGTGTTDTLRDQD